MKKGVNKKAAFEMSVTTIIVIVLAVTMLIMGMILIRSIMCAGIGMSENIKEKMDAEISSLFGERDFGVRCMGEAGQERPKLLDGGTREIYCVFREEGSRKYKLVVKEIKVKTGDEDIESWIIDRDGWDGTIGAGKQIERVAILEIPRGVSKTTLGIVVEEYKGGSTSVTKTHSLLVDVESASSFNRAIC